MLRNPLARLVCVLTVAFLGFSVASTAAAGAKVRHVRRQGICVKHGRRARLRRHRCLARRAYLRRHAAPVASIALSHRPRKGTTTTSTSGSTATTTTSTGTTTTSTGTTSTTTTTSTGTTSTGTTSTTTSTLPAIANPYGQRMFGIAAGGTLQNEDATTLGQDLDVDHNAGSKWIRVDINWAQIQNGGSTSYNWSALDSVVQGASARGMQVLGVIVYTPGWARPSGTSATYGPAPATYANFAAAAAAHLAPEGVHAYEIWNEENMVQSWTPAPSTAAYTALLRAAYPAIKGVDPSATVVTGGLSPAPSDGTEISPVDFISGIYANGGKGYFDAVGDHPYCWPAMPGDVYSWSPWYQMIGATPSVRSVMVANGDSAKQIWATEFGAPTNGPSGSFVDEATQAAMITKAYQLWSTYSWGGPLFTYQGRDLGTDTSTRENFFGLVRNDWTPKPSFAAYQQAVATL